MQMLYIFIFLVSKYMSPSCLELPWVEQHHRWSIITKSSMIGARWSLMPWFIWTGTDHTLTETTVVEKTLPISLSRMHLYRIVRSFITKEFSWTDVQQNDLRHVGMQMEAPFFHAILSHEHIMSSWFLPDVVEKHQFAHRAIGDLRGTKYSF